MMADKKRNLIRAGAEFVRAFGAAESFRAAIGLARYGLHRTILPRYVRRRVHGFDLWLDATDSGLSRELLIRGQREAQLRALIEETVTAGQVVLDVGANVGYYTLQLSRLVGATGTVYALEPAPANAALLRRNLAEAGSIARNVEVFECAAGDRDGTDRLYLAPQSNLHTMSAAVAARVGSAPFTDVDVVALSTFIRGRKRPDFLRMDVEGFEVEVLRGLRQAVSDGSFRGTICFEVHPERYNSRDRNLRPELEFLFSNGYVATALTSADEAHRVVSTLGYSPDRTLRTHATRFRGIYRHVAHDDVLSLVCDRGGVRDLLLSPSR